MSATETVPVIGVGASAGGVEAMRQLFAHLPGDLPAAVLVVLHVPPESSSQLAAVLAAVCRLPVSVAADGEPPRAGHVYVATPDRHLLVQDGRVHLSRGPRECRMRPAVDVLFRSLAAEFGRHAAGVVLSGTLDDGTAGLWAIKEHGGHAFVQDPAEALHPGMPQNAMAHMEVDGVAGASALAGRLQAWATGALQAAHEVQAPRPGVRIELAIAAGAHALQCGVMDLGQPSPFTCPECHGVLVQLEEGRVVRFRCHTGHAYSMRSLLAEVDVAIDNSLWSSCRAIEERQLLLRELSAAARQRGAAADAEAYALRAQDLERVVKALRQLLHDPALFAEAESGTRPRDA